MAGTPPYWPGALGGDQGVGQTFPPQATAIGRPPLSGFGYVPSLGVYAPNDQALTVYVQPEALFLGTGYPGVGEHGSDAPEIDGTDPLYPIRSWDGFARKYGTRIRDGARIILQGLGSGPDRDAPTNGRILYVRNVDLELFGESWRTNLTIRGPRKMFALTPTRRLTGYVDEVVAGNLTGRVLLTFDGAMGGAGTYFLTSYRADGRELFWPIPCLGDNGGTGVYISAIAAASLAGAGLVPGTDSWYLACPAAHIAPDTGDTYFKGTHFSGHGAARVGDRFSATAPTFDPNQWPLLERVSVSGATFQIDGSYALDAVRFSDKAWFIGGEPLLRGCVSEGDVTWQSGGPFYTSADQFVATEMAGGRMLWYDAAQGLAAQRYTGVSNPDDPVSGCDLVVTGSSAAGASLWIGMAMGGRPGQFRVLKGLAVNGPGIRLFGRSSSLWCAATSRLALIAAAAGNTALWVTGGAMVRLNANNPLWNYTLNPASAVYAGTRIYGTVNHLRCDFGAAIVLGTGVGGFGEVAGWNGVFTRRQAAAGGFATDLDSVIWDAYNEPAGFDRGI